MNQPDSSAAPAPATSIASGRQTSAAAAAPASAAVARSDRLPVGVWLVAAAFVALQLAVSGRYGFQQDELYFIVAGHHLAFGYVDQPPIAPLLTRVTGLLGVSPTAIRIVPALAGGATVVMAGKLAALFDAGRLGRVLAAIATACAPVLLGATHIANTTPLDLLAWTTVLLCTCMALLRGLPRWWLLAGATAGLGLESDNLLILLLIGIFIGILASAHRGVLRTPWPWLGAAIAAVIWSPNLIWQAANGWPQLAMASALHRENISPADYAASLPAQLVYAGLLATPLLIAGLVTLWRTPELRFIVVATALIVVYVVAWIPGRPYYTDGVLPAVLAAGSVAAERWIARGRRSTLRRVLVLARPGDRCCGDTAGRHPRPAGQCRPWPAGDRSAERAWRHRRMAAADRCSCRRGRRPGTERRSRRPRSSPGTTQKPGHCRFSARATTCRPCCPARTPTGRGGPAMRPTAPCSRSTRSARCGPTSAACPAPDYLLRAGQRAQRLDRHPDRRVHQPDEHLARAVAAAEVLRLGPAASRRACDRAICLRRPPGTCAGADQLHTGRLLTSAK